MHFWILLKQMHKFAMQVHKKLLRRLNNALIESNTIWKAILELEFFLLKVVETITYIVYCQVKLRVIVTVQFVQLSYIMTLRHV